MNVPRTVKGAANHWTDNGPWMLADDVIVSFYLNHSGIALVNVRTTLLERGNAGLEVGLTCFHASYRLAISNFLIFQTQNR